jgi:hypothetical protein
MIILELVFVKSTETEINMPQLPTLYNVWDKLLSEHLDVQA